MWSVAATSKGGGGDFQFAIQNTRQIKFDEWTFLNNFSARLMKLFQCQYTRLLAKYIRLISHNHTAALNYPSALLDGAYHT